MRTLEEVNAATNSEPPSDYARLLAPTLKFIPNVTIQTKDAAKEPSHLSFGHTRPTYPLAQQTQNSRK